MFGFSIGTKTLDYVIGIIPFLVSLVVNAAIYIILSFESFLIFIVKCYSIEIYTHIYV